MGLIPQVLSSTFPAPRPGPHKHLGYAFLTTSPLSPWSSPFPIFKSTQKPALNIHEIGYSVYYPSIEPKKGWLGGGERTVDWIGKPKEEFVRGLERFLGQKAYWILVQAARVVLTRMKFQANLNSPLLPPVTKYPLIIFSHGLAGTRTTYSQYCSALASEGYVVLSIEHRDGSGPSVSVPSGEGDGEKDGILHYIRQEDISWGDEEKPLLAGRTMQLEMRKREVYEVYHSFTRILANEVEPNVEGLDESEKIKWLGSFKGNVDLDDLSLTSHSFGGATAIDVLQTPPPDDKLGPLPLKRVIALDPWLEPLETPSGSTSASASMPPLLVCNSPGFTIWKGHFERLLKLVSKAEGSLITVMHGNHQSFSDYPLLMPFSSGQSLRFLDKTHQLSIAFLRGNLGSSPLLQGLTADGGAYQRDEKGHMTSTDPVVLHL